ncbi:ATP-grasp domain-containing protein [Massilia sp. W12]|uniref:ATP-grasp domain-containing protein n=1 Tax=Massilia sp. W12 TaxID=3126507 RepID=UPI0030D04D77
MHWILQNNLFHETGWQALRDALQRFDLPFSEHKVIPFVGELLPPPQVTHQNVICFGAYSMRHVARRFGWNPGVFDLAGYEFDTQRAHWGAHMLNADSQVQAIGEADFFADELFLRPVDDSKGFAGQVMTREAFETWRETLRQAGELDPSGLNLQSLIQLARPKKVYAEFRFWIVKGEIITQSMYKRGSVVQYAPLADQRLHAFVRQMIALWLPLETLVLDVCDTAEGIKIVEINTMNAAGFYAADMQKLVLALHAAYDQGLDG